MAKISNLPAAGAVTGAELIPIVQDGETRRLPASAFVTKDGSGRIPLAALPDAVVGALKYQGVWNASTNSPAIPAAAAANLGWYRRVSVAGATSVSGVTDWKVGDWIVSNGASWDKIDNSDQVTSVAGRQGAVTLTSADLGDSTAPGRALLSAADVSTQRALLQLGGAARLNVNETGGVQGYRQELMDIAQESTAFGRDLLNYADLAALQVDLLGGYLDDLSSLKAALASGALVKIACYGDSTTDGNGTTGHTVNPGGVDHGAGAGSNAWPTQMKAILSDMYPGNNIRVWNAGYSGRSIYNGWARDNYVSAVINNPAYGVPDFCFVQFGWNDDVNFIATGRLADYVQQTKETVRLIQSYGTKVILLACDPGGRQETAERDNRRVVALLDNAKRAVATELGCAFLDHSDLMKSVFRHSRSAPVTFGAGGGQSRWFAEQPDLLHGGDNWHRLKASAIATLLNSNVVVQRPGERIKVQTPDSATTYNNLGGSLDSTTGSLTGMGGNFFLDAATADNNGYTLEVFVWCDQPGVALYRSTDNEGYNPTGGGSGPLNHVHSYTYAEAINRRSRNYGFDLGNNGAGLAYTPTDLPVMMLKLHPGLNRLRYQTGTQSSQRYYGYWDLYPVDPPKSRDGLGAHGMLFRAFAATGPTAVFLPEDPNLGNVFTVPAAGGFERAEFYYDVTLPTDTGIILLHNQSWKGSATYGDRSGLLLFRHSSNTFRMYPIYTRGTTVTFGTLWDKASDGGTLATTGDDMKLRVALTRNTGGVQRWSVSQDWRADDVTVHDRWDRAPIEGTLAMPWGGVAGGLFGNTTVGKSAAIKSLTVVHSAYSAD